MPVGFLLSPIGKSRMLDFRFFVASALLSQNPDIEHKRDKPHLEVEVLRILDLDWMLDIYLQSTSDTKV